MKKNGLDDLVTEIENFINQKTQDFIKIEPGLCFNITLADFEESLEKTNIK
jgi:hypothetical protein